MTEGLEFDAGDEPAAIPFVAEGETKEIGWYRLPPVGNDTGEVSVRVLILTTAPGGGRVIVQPATDDGDAVGPEAFAVFGSELGEVQWVERPLTLPQGAGTLRVSVWLHTGQVAVMSAVVDTDTVELLSDGTEAPETWGKLSALYFEEPDFDRPDDVHVPRRLAGQHAHVVGRMPRVLAARAMVPEPAGPDPEWSAVRYRYRFRNLDESRVLKVRILAMSVGRSGELEIEVGSATHSAVGALTQVDSVSVPVSSDWVWFELTVPAASVSPGLFGWDLAVAVKSRRPQEALPEQTIIQAIRVEEAPPAMEAFDITSSSRFACAPARALPADTGGFLPGRAIVDTYREGAAQGVWSDRRSAVSNALFRAADHACVYVADHFPWTKTGEDELHPAGVPSVLRWDMVAEELVVRQAHMRGTPSLPEALGLIEPVLPAPLWRTLHTASRDAESVRVMARFRLPQPAYQQFAWISLWRDGEEVVPLRPLHIEGDGWTAVGDIPVVPGATHDLELRAARGDASGPYEHVDMVGLQMPGIAAWEIPARASPRRVYWYGAVSEIGGGSRLRLEVPESRDFEVRKIRLRLARINNHTLNIHLVKNPGEPDEVTQWILEGAYPVDSWYSHWRIGDAAPNKNDLSPFVGLRAAGVWELQCNVVFPYMEHFELELE